MRFGPASDRVMQSVETVLRNLRFAMRSWRKTPAFAFAAVATLALAIGANTAIFSVVSGVLLRPLPFPHPDRLPQLYVTSPAAVRLPVLYVTDGDLWGWRHNAAACHG